MVRSHYSQINPKRFITHQIGIGLKSTIESIDNRADFKIYMQNYAYARGGTAPRGPRREGPAEEGFVRHSHFLFGIFINATISCLRCRPTGVAHILFIQMLRLGVVTTPKYLIRAGQHSA